LAALALRYETLRERDYLELNIAKEEMFLGMIFIYCNIQKKKQYTKQYKTQNTQNRKQNVRKKKQNRNSSKEHKSSNNKITNGSK